MRGRVREYLQTMFKLEMYRYYLEKYILDHVLQIFRGGGGIVLFLSLMKEGKLNVLRQGTAAFNG